MWGERNKCSKSILDSVQYQWFVERVCVCAYACACKHFESRSSRYECQKSGRDRHIRSIETERCHWFGIGFSFYCRAHTAYITSQLLLLLLLRYFTSTHTKQPKRKPFRYKALTHKAHTITIWVFVQVDGILFVPFLFGVVLSVSGHCSVLIEANFLGHKNKYSFPLKPKRIFKLFQLVPIFDQIKRINQKITEIPSKWIFSIDNIKNKKVFWVLSWMTHKETVCAYVCIYIWQVALRIA